eukprot:gene28122-40073_t
MVNMAMDTGPPPAPPAAPPPAVAAGLRTVTVRRAPGQQLGAALDEDFRVTEVDVGSPAAAAGVQPGWQIAAIAGQAVSNEAEIVAAMGTAFGEFQMGFAVPEGAPGGAAAEATVTVRRAEGERLGMAMKAASTAIGTVRA